MENKKSDFIVKTKSGYLLKEVASALQKSIRRGNTDDALYWAEELFISGLERYLLYRLWIIACEDIGPANLQLVQLATSTYQTWLLQKKERKEFTHSGENRVLNGLLVCLMTTSPKNRVADDSTQVMAMKRAQGYRIEIPDHAIDSHTDKTCGRFYRHWVDVGSKCSDLIDSRMLGLPSYKEEAESMYLELAQIRSEGSYTDEEVKTRNLK